MMNQILLPVDFSTTSANAYRYAQEVAKEKGYNIQVVHIHQPSYDPTNPYLTENVLNLEEEKKEKLAKFIKSIQVKGFDVEARVSSILLVGFPADEVVRLANSEEVKLVLMGTTGDGGLLEQLFGSVSIAVAQRSNKPVILVPPNSEYKGINHILFGGHYDSSAPHMIDQIVEFAGTFQAEIHFIHVKATEEEQDVVNETIFNELLAEGSPGVAFEISSVTNKKVWDGLHDYATKNNIDLTTLVIPKRSWLERLFHKSVSKEMILHADIPIMVLHA